VLEEHGLDQNDYRLNDFIDVDALNRVALSRAETMVKFSVEGIYLTVTADGVQATTEEESR